MRVLLSYPSFCFRHLPAPNFGLHVVSLYFAGSLRQSGLLVCQSGAQGIHHLVVRVLLTYPSFCFRHLPAPDFGLHVVSLYFADSLRQSGFLVCQRRLETPEGAFIEARPVQFLLSRGKFLPPGFGLQLMLLYFNREFCQCRLCLARQFR